MCQDNNINSLGVPELSHSQLGWHTVDLWYLILLLLCSEIVLQLSYYVLLYKPFNYYHHQKYTSSPITDKIKSICTLQRWRPGL